jgi:hypothetical protein
VCIEQTSGFSIGSGPRPKEENGTSEDQDAVATCQNATWYAMAVDLRRVNRDCKSKQAANNVREGMHEMSFDE